MATQSTSKDYFLFKVKWSYEMRVSFNLRWFLMNQMVVAIGVVQADHDLGCRGYRINFSLFYLIENYSSNTPFRLKEIPSICSLRFEELIDLKSSTAFLFIFPIFSYLVIITISLTKYLPLSIGSLFITYLLFWLINSAQKSWLCSSSVSNLQFMIDTITIFM